MTNDLSNVIPQLMAMGLQALRESCILPRLTNRDYQTMAVRKGNTIDIPISSAISARDVTPAVAFASNVDSEPTLVSVTMDTWKEAPFYLTDDDLVSAEQGIMPMQASEAIKALGNAVDDLILSKHTGIYSAVGTAGTTPFASAITVAGTARKLLNKTLCPPQNRSAVLDPDAEDNLLQLSNILQFDQRGDQGGIIEGTIGRKLGFDWYMDQNVASYTPGTGWASGNTVLTAGGAVGAATLSLISASASGSVKVGDIFTLASDTDSQQYVVTVAATASTSVAFTIGFNPALQTTIVSGCTLTVVSVAYVANIAFHRDAFAWASRPLLDVQGLGNPMQTVVDPVSGVALRLEVSRQYKQTTFSYDVLCGAELVRPELAVKIFG